MEVKTKAIVLRTVKYGDQSLIVDMLTEKHGRVSFIVRISKTKKGKLRKQFFNPMTVLEIDFDYHQRSRLQHLRDARIAVPLNSIAMNPSKMAITIFLAEFLAYVTRDEQGDSALYVYVETGLRWLDAATEDYANFHIVFMIQLSRFAGFWPNLDDYYHGCVFDMREGRYASSVPLHTDFLDWRESRFANFLVKLDFYTMRHLHLNGAQRNQIADIIIGYYRLHIPLMPELRSLAVLREVFR